MAIRRKEQLRSFFKRGAYPTESQFGDLIESMRHKLEPVPMSDVQGLPGALNGKADGEDVAAALESLAESLQTVSTAIDGIKESLKEKRPVQDDFWIDMGTGNNLENCPDEGLWGEQIAGNCSEGDIVRIDANGEKYFARVLQIESYAVSLVEVCRKGGVFIWEFNTEHGDISRRRI